MSPVTLFIVDDNVLFARLLKAHIARTYHFAISVFSTGELCLAHLHLKPEMLILDYRLGEEDAINGKQILQVAKECYWKPKVIFLSNQQDKSAELLALGIQAFIAKDNHVFSNLDVVLKANLGAVIT